MIGNEDKSPRDLEKLLERTLQNENDFIKKNNSKIKLTPPSIDEKKILAKAFELYLPKWKNVVNTAEQEEFVQKYVQCLSRTSNSERSVFHSCLEWCVDADTLFSKGKNKPYQITACLTDSFQDIVAQPDAPAELLNKFQQVNKKTTASEDICELIITFLKKRKKQISCEKQCAATQCSELLQRVILSETSLDQVLYVGRLKKLGQDSLSKIYEIVRSLNKNPGAALRKNQELKLDYFLATQLVDLCSQHKPDFVASCFYLVKCFHEVGFGINLSAQKTQDLLTKLSVLHACPEKYRSYIFESFDKLLKDSNGLFNEFASCIQNIYCSPIQLAIPLSVLGSIFFRLYIRTPKNERKSFNSIYDEIEIYKNLLNNINEDSLEKITDLLHKKRDLVTALRKNGYQYVAAILNEKIVTCAPKLKILCDPPKTHPDYTEAIVSQLPELPEDPNVLDSYLTCVHHITPFKNQEDRKVIIKGIKALTHAAQVHTKNFPFLSIIEKIVDSACYSSNVCYESRAEITIGLVNCSEKGVTNNAIRVVAKCLQKIYDSEKGSGMPSKPSLPERISELLQRMQPLQQEEVISSACSFLDNYTKICPTNNENRSKAEMITKRANDFLDYLTSTATILERENSLKNWEHAIFNRKNTERTFTQEVERYQEPKAMTPHGVELYQVQTRLCAYAEALSGRKYGIKKSGDLRIQSRAEQDFLILPEKINKKSDQKENLQLYKALVSYQIAEVLFPWKNSDKCNRKEETDNEALWTKLYQIVQFSRFDACLLETYPGIAKDLNILKEVKANEFSEYSDDFLRTLSYALYSNKLPAKVSQEKVQDLEQCLNIIQKCHTPTLTYKEAERATQKLHEICEKYWTEAGPCVFEEIPATYVLPVFIKDQKQAPLVSSPKKVDDSLCYPEWNSETNTYQEDRVRLFECSLTGIFEGKKTQTDQATIDRVRDLFESLKPEKRVVIRRLRSGDPDIDEIIKAHADMKSGVTPSERLFLREFKRERSVATLLLTEISQSLRDYVNWKTLEERYIDIIHRTMFYLSEGLESAGDAYAVCCFSGDSEKHVEFYTLKNFDDPVTPETRERILCIKPQKQNRDGAGIRHSTALLNTRNEKTRFLLYTTDGIPNDVNYKGDYAMQDTAKALMEASQTGVTPVVISVGVPSELFVTKLQNEGIIHQNVPSCHELPSILPDLYFKLIQKC